MSRLQFEHAVSDTRHHAAQECNKHNLCLKEWSPVVPSASLIERQLLSGFVACRYLAFGSSMDYMYEELNVQYPLTIEVGLARCLMSVCGYPPSMHTQLRLKLVYRAAWDILL